MDLEEPPRYGGATPSGVYRDPARVICDDDQGRRAEPAGLGDDHATHEDRRPDRAEPSRRDRDRRRSGGSRRGGRRRRAWARPKATAKGWAVPRARVRWSATGTVTPWEWELREGVGGSRPRARRRASRGGGPLEAGPGAVGLAERACARPTTDPRNGTAPSSAAGPTITRTAPELSSTIRPSPSAQEVRRLGHGRDAAWSRRPSSGSRGRPSPRRVVSGAIARRVR